MQEIKQDLPPGLPPLPPLPEGYVRWEYRGMDGLSSECPPVSASLLYKGGYPTNDKYWHIYNYEGPISRTRTHWLEAIPATPRVGDGVGSADVIGDSWPFSDISVRLWLAGQALPALVEKIVSAGMTVQEVEYASESALVIADALIAADKRKEDGV